MTKEERKSMFVSKALSMSMGADPEEVVKEAEEMFDKQNEDAE